MPWSLRRCLALPASALLLSSPVCAFQSPLSDQAVREAYFLGQRHDESLAKFLDKYAKHLDLPKTGPHIASIALLTPFAIAVLLSSEHTTGYSAQQAALDHRDQEESVRVAVQINFTESYGALMPPPSGSRPGSPATLVLRPYDFWEDFDVRVTSEDKELKAFTSWGEPSHICSPDGGCTLVGATIYMEFLASAFTSGTATVQVEPPEGPAVSVEFDLASLR